MTEKSFQELVNEQFHKDNFIIKTSKANDEKWAAVYCSSNGVYRDDTVECFEKTILKADYYEWYMTRFPNASKHIFIRDITKRFYQFGINDNGLDSLEKIAEMIKKETEGYKVVTIGSSAGATAASAIGKLVNAEFTIAASPIFRPFKPDENEAVVKQKIETKEYCDALTYAQSEVPIFYIFPTGSDWDIYNSSLVENYQNVYFLPISSNVHGVPVNKRILKKLMSLSKQELVQNFKYKRTESVSEYKFARECLGFKFYLLRIADFIKKYPFFFLKKDFYTLVLR